MPIFFDDSRKDRLGATISRFNRANGDKISLRMLKIVGKPPGGTLQWSGETPAPWGVWTHEEDDFQVVNVCRNGDAVADAVLRVRSPDTLAANDFIWPEPVGAVEPVAPVVPTVAIEPAGAVVLKQNPPGTAKWTVSCKGADALLAAVCRAGGTTAEPYTGWTELRFGAASTAAFEGAAQANGDKLVVRALDGKNQWSSGAVSFEPPVAPSVPTIKVEPEAEGVIEGTPPKDFTWTIRATGTPSVKAAVFQVSADSPPKWSSKASFTTLAVPTSGVVTHTGTLLGDGDRLVVKTLDDKHEFVTKGATFRKPVPVPVPTSADLNIFIRGQSNALLFCDYGGDDRLAADLAALLGRKVHLLASWGRSDSKNTINSGTAFMDWPKDGQQQGLLGFLRDLPAETKARQTLTLWMHNEYEQKNAGLVAATYAAEIRKDAELVRGVLGQGAATTPYLFATIRYNYGPHLGTVKDGWNLLVADTAFNARVTDAPWSAVMDGDGAPDSSHMGRNDAVAVGAKLAAEIAAWIGKQPGPGPTPKIASVDVVTQGDLAEAEPGAGVPVRFRVATENLPEVVVVPVRPDWSWRAERRRTVAVPPSGTLEFEETMYPSGELIKALSPDLKLSKDSPQVAVKAKPRPVGEALGRVRKVIAPWRFGLNIERGKTLWNGWLTDGVLRSYAAAGVTHLRFFPPTGRGSVMAPGDIRLWVDACRRTVAAGMGAHLDLLDYVGIEHMNDGVANYVRECGKIIAAEGPDPTKFVVGSTNEWAGGDNKLYAPWITRLSDILHAELPNHVIVVNGGYWGAPENLMAGGFPVRTDRPQLIQWHLYDNNAGDPNAAIYWQKRLVEWSKNNGDAVTYCGEWGVGPPDNSNGAATKYEPFPDHIRHACRGMGQQRPVMWTVTDGGWWRLNVGDGARLRPEIESASKEGSAHIASQDWYKAGLAAT